MRDGRAGILGYPAKEAQERSFLEYWLYSAPARVLLDFIACTPPTTLAHGVCDVRFSTFIRDHAGAPTAYYYSPTPRLFWMYYHRQHDAQLTKQLRSEAPVIDRDRRTAATLWQSGALAAAEDVEGPDAEDLVAARVAEIRRDVEMLVLYGLVAVEDLVGATLRRQELLDHPDAQAWADLAVQLANEAIPHLAPPGWIAWANGAGGEAATEAIRSGLAAAAAEAIAGKGPAALLWQASHGWQ